MPGLEISLTLGLLAVALALFVTEWIRYDLVALLVLLTLNLTGILTVEESFSGFSNPAVITVAAVLVMSRAVQGSGMVQGLASRVIAHGGRTSGRLICVVMLGAGGVSGFINDVGAAALFLPLVVLVARRAEIAPSKLLIPLAFGCLLGGTLTMIGTPPNLLITQIMATHGIEPFTMFAFTPIGVLVMVSGVLYMTLVGQHLLPVRRGEADLVTRFRISDYLVEARVSAGSALADRKLEEARLEDLEFNILGVIRGERAFLAPRPRLRLRAGDLLLLTVAPDRLTELTRRGGLEIVPGVDLGQADLASKVDHVELTEAVVLPDSPCVGRTLKQLHLRRRLGLSVMAISRHGQSLLRRLADHPIQPGDTLLIQGDSERLYANLPDIGCLPLASREILLRPDAPIIRTLGIFGAAIILAAVGVLHVAVAFSLGAFAMIASRCLRLETAYRAISWPVLVLMGGMIPLGLAMEKTGAAGWVASTVVGLLNSTDPTLLLAVLFGLVSALTMVLNNPTVAVVTAPVAIDLARVAGASPRPFLMMTAVAASCAFLAPISHKANILVWGPGGYRFLDYAKVGLPLVLIVGLVCIGCIPLLFPF